MNGPRPFREDDAPGRIPESLIDAVLDGSVDDRTRREVARALRHDPRRRQDVEETVEVIDAMRMPIECPDFSGTVLERLDRKHRFLPARVRRSLRQARLGLGLAAMVALVAVAGAQRFVPRLASIAPPPTPVSDVAQAVRADACRAAEDLKGGVQVVQASLPSIHQALAPRDTNQLKTPGRTYRLDINADRVIAEAQRTGTYRLVAIDGGRYLFVDTIQGCSPGGRDGTRTGSLVSMMLVSSADAGVVEAAEAPAEPTEPETDDLP